MSLFLVVDPRCSSMSISVVAFCHLSILKSLWENLPCLLYASEIAGNQDGVLCRSPMPRAAP